MALGAPDAPVRDLEISALFLMFALRLVVPIFSPMGEEPGWRGFALPRMLVGRSPFAVTVVLGLIVAVWHVPLVFIESEDLAPIFLLTTVAVTFFYTWLFINTGGSVFITILAHAMEGVISREYVATDGWAGADESHWTWLYTAAWCAVAVIVVALDRKFWRARAKDSADPVVANPALAGAR